MTATDPDDDTPQRHDHGPRNLALGLTALALAAGAAYAVNARFDREREAHERQRAADAWSDLSRCLAGDLRRVGEIARTARRAELRVPSTARVLPAAAQAREWPWRCAPYAQSLTQSIFASHSEDPALRLLARFASIAATELSQRALRTERDTPRRYLDELFAAAARANLPPARRSTVAPPPEPMRVLDPSRVRPLLRARGASQLVALPAYDTGALRVLLGRPERRVCDFDRDLDWPTCERAPALDAIARVSLSPARPPLMPLWRTRGDHESGELRAPAHPETVLHPRAVDAWRETRDGAVILAALDDTATPRYALFDNAREALALPPIEHLAQPPALFDRHVIVVTENDTAPSSDGGVARRVEVRAATVSREGAWRFAEPFTLRGTVTAAGEVPMRGCWSPTVERVAVYGSDGRGLVLTWREGRFVRADEVPLGAGTVSCDGAVMRAAWYAPSPSPAVHVTTCDAQCAHAEAPAPLVDGTPQVAALGARVLVVHTGETFGGLRYRYGPLATIADANDTVVFDDAAHDGVDFDAPATVLTRGDLAVLVATRAAPPYETWAVRIDGQGFRTVRLREP